MPAVKGVRHECPHCHQDFWRPRALKRHHCTAAGRGQSGASTTSYEATSRRGSTGDAVNNRCTSSTRYEAPPRQGPTGASTTGGAAPSDRASASDLGPEPQLHIDLTLSPDGGSIGDTVPWSPEALGVAHVVPPTVVPPRKRLLLGGEASDERQRRICDCRRCVMHAAALFQRSDDERKAVPPHRPGIRLVHLPEQVRADEGQLREVTSVAVRYPQRTWVLCMCAICTAHRDLARAWMRAQVVKGHEDHGPE
jgi:hypothetical protein